MYLFDKVKTIASCDGLSAAVADEAAFIRLNSSEYVLFPGFCDVHVHFREPGFSYKETILSGSLAAAHGGYTAVCTMPNLNPVPDCPEKLRPQREQIARDAVMAVFPYGAISVDEKGEQLADLEGLAPLVCAFSDDGHGVQDAGMMREAMQRCRALGKLIAAHCEDNSLLHGGCIHDGAWARAHGYRGISSESEWRQIERDLRLADETGCRYHVCHISTKESVCLIRDAKSSGVDVSCETAPHYLLLDENDLQEDGRFKMNPPLRAREDREALLEGLTDGTVDMIATDHAPDGLSPALHRSGPARHPGPFPACRSADTAAEKPLRPARPRRLQYLGSERSGNRRSRCLSLKGACHALCRAAGQRPLSPDGL